MLTLLKTRLVALIQTKVGVAVLAAVLVAGGGTAVAMASTHGNIGAVGSSLAHTTATAGHDGSNQDNSDTGNANRLSVEGTLKAYTAAAGSTPASISVTDQHATSYSIVVNANTKVNGVHASSLNDLKNAVGHKV